MVGEEYGSREEASGGAVGEAAEGGGRGRGETPTAALKGWELSICVT